MTQYKGRVKVEGEKRAELPGEPGPRRNQKPPSSVVLAWLHIIRFSFSEKAKIKSLV